VGEREMILRAISFLIHKLPLVLSLLRKQIGFFESVLTMKLHTTQTGHSILKEMGMMELPYTTSL
jgi:hypothetical protein